MFVHLISEFARELVEEQRLVERAVQCLDGDRMLRGCATMLCRDIDELRPKNISESGCGAGLVCRRSFDGLGGFALGRHDQALRSEQ
jgi:hypothetical protein